MKHDPSFTARPLPHAWVKEPERMVCTRCGLRRVAAHEPGGTGYVTPAGVRLVMVRRPACDPVAVASLGKAPSTGATHGV